MSLYYSKNGEKKKNVDMQFKISWISYVWEQDATKSRKIVQKAEQNKPVFSAIRGKTPEVDSGQKNTGI